MLEVGGIPKGDYTPAPWLLASRGYALWLETDGDGAEFDLGHRVAVSSRAAAGQLRLHVICDSTPAARLRRYLRLTGLPALLPEWGYGHWKSRDVYEHQDDVLDDFEGYERNSLPLDAVVIDSPWETQYNTWRFNPHQFPDPQGMIDRMRAAGVRTVVWVTPWVNLDSRDGQRPPGPESERMHREPAPNYRRGRPRGPLRARSRGRAVRRALVDGHRVAGGLQLARRRRMVARAGATRARDGRRGNQGGRRRGLLLPARGPVRRRPHGRRGGLGLRGPLPPLDAARAGRGPPGPRRAVRPLRLDRPAGGRRHMGRRPGLGLLVARRRWWRPR